MKNSDASGVANAHESGESKGVAAVAGGFGANTQSASTAEYQEAIEAFGAAMLAKLQENAHKGRRIAWQNWRPDCMAGRLSEELRELAEAIDRGDAKEAMREAADCANFALMVWDWYACRQTSTPNIGHEPRGGS